MSNLPAIPKVPRRSLGRTHAPRKRFGQNFLTDQTVISQITDAICITQGMTLVEIGPGLGALTGPLWHAFTRVNTTDQGAFCVIEIDRDLAQMLPKTLDAIAPVDARFHLVNESALLVDFAHLRARLGEGTPKIHVIGNLPYNISTPLLFHLSAYKEAIASLVFMLQKEVVMRITAKAGTKEYGRLSVMMQYHFDCHYLLTVPSTAFVPAPKVTSSVFRLTPKAPTTVAQDADAFARLVRHSFGQRRKTLRKSLQSLEGFLVNEDVFAKAHIDPAMRPEVLSVDDFVRLSNAMLTHKVRL